MPGVPAEQACAVAAWTGPATRARLEALLCDARISRVLLSPPGRSPASRSSAPPSPRPNAARSPPATSAASPAAAPDPPAMTDVHHLVRQADGGTHDLDNLVLLCRRHHVLWHLGKTTLADLHVPWHPDARAGAGPPAA
jgi:hypothetical protein